jgi:hypothetical protein
VPRSGRVIVRCAALDAVHAHGSAASAA